MSMGVPRDRMAMPAGTVARSTRRRRPLWQARDFNLPTTNSEDPIDVTETEGRIVVPYTLVVSTRGTHGSVRDDFGIDSLVFTKRASVVSDTFQHVTQMRSISALNAHLMSPQGRARYGASADADQLTKDWHFWGIQQTQTDNYLRTNARVQSITTLISHRAKTHNIWMASNNNVRNLRSLWLVLRRLPYSSIDVFGNKRQRAGGDGASAGYYWRYEPWCGHRDEAPPRELYMGWSWCGTAIRVGLVSDTFGHNRDGEEHRMTANKATFPTEVGKQWHLDSAKLPRVELQLNVG